MTIYFFAALAAAALAFYAATLIAPKGMRTFAINLVGLLPIAGDLVAEAMNIAWAAYLTEDAAKGIGLALVIANLLIRTVTNTAPLKSE